MPGPHKAGELAAQLSLVMADDDTHMSPGNTQSDLCLPQVRLVWGTWFAGRISNAHNAHAWHLEGSLALYELQTHFSDTVETAQPWRWRAPITVLPRTPAKSSSQQPGLMQVAQLQGCLVRHDYEMPR